MLNHLLMISLTMTMMCYIKMMPMTMMSICIDDDDDNVQGIIAIKPSGLKSWEGSITFCVCTVGFVLGLPIGTEVGAHQYDSNGDDDDDDLLAQRWVGI